MHENRETSGAPVKSAGRPEKAKSRNAGKNAAEESDRGVVAMKQPNKEEQTSAEAAEQRPWGKENSNGTQHEPDAERG